MLLGGNHAAVAKWRREQSELRSRKLNKTSGECQLPDEPK